MATQTSGTNTEARTFGRYELVTRLSAGSLGDLWVGRIIAGPEEGRVVAIRLIPRPYSMSDADVSEQTAVGFSAMELRHPSVAAVLDVVVSGGEVAIVSEHVDGTLLSDILPARGAGRVKVPPGVALRIVLDVLSAIEAIAPEWAEVAPSPPSGAAASGAGTMHGGLLPDGVVVAVFGETMLLEVGFAGAAMRIPALADKPEIIAYRAPEQLEGGVVDERADVFTAGVLSWELLSGRRLFGGAPPPPRASTAASDDGDRAPAARKRVQSGPIQRLDALPGLSSVISKECADFVARCLERDPAKRYQTIQEAREALQRIQGIAEHPAVAELMRSSRSHPSDADLSAASGRPTTPPEDRVTMAPETRPTVAQISATERHTVSTAPADMLPRIAVDAASSGRTVVESVEPISVEPVSKPPPPPGASPAPAPAAFPPPAQGSAPKRHASLRPKSLSATRPKTPSLPPASGGDIPPPPAFLSASAPAEAPSVFPPKDAGEGLAEDAAIATASAAPVVKPLPAFTQASTEQQPPRSGPGKVVVLAIAVVVLLLIAFLILRPRSSGSDETAGRPPPRGSAAAAQASAVAEAPPSQDPRAEAPSTAPPPAVPEGAHEPGTTMETASPQPTGPTPETAAQAAPVPAGQVGSAVPGRPQEPRRDGKKPYRPSGI